MTPLKRLKDKDMKNCMEPTKKISDGEETVVIVEDEVSSMAPEYEYFLLTYRMRP